MEDQEQQLTGSRLSHRSEAEPVRSRWTPKPEQILILESLFNSGIVNPPKDETVKIRKRLEEFGSVGDTNVFYWFQNRRSRSRRRQRQIQAAATGTIRCENDKAGAGSYSSPDNIILLCPMNAITGSGSGSSSFGPDGSVRDACDDLFSFPGRTAGVREVEQKSGFGAPDTSYCHYQSAVTVFINGVATEVGRGPLDVKATFGGDFVLLHSPGAAIEMDELGFLVQNLQHGESYFLVPRQ